MWSRLVLLERTKSAAFLGHSVNLPHRCPLLGFIDGAWLPCGSTHPLSAGFCIHLFGVTTVNHVVSLPIKLHHEKQYFPLKKSSPILNTIFPPLHAPAQGLLMSQGDVVRWAEPSLLSLVPPLLATVLWPEDSTAPTAAPAMSFAFPFALSQTQSRGDNIPIRTSPARLVPSPRGPSSSEPLIAHPGAGGSLRSSEGSSIRRYFRPVISAEGLPDNSLNELGSFVLEWFCQISWSPLWGRGV